MLTELHIENLGVIERVEVDPRRRAHGRCTGETGAGKTMLVEAIELLVGGRADATIVRHGADEARVDGRFVTHDGDELVLSRVVPADGRSRAYVERPAGHRRVARRDHRPDWSTCTASTPTRACCPRATQRAALDQFGDVDLAPLRSARARLTEIDAELATLGGDERARPARSTCCASRSTSSTPPGVVDPDEDDRLDAEEALLADAVGPPRGRSAAADALRCRPTERRDAVVRMLGAALGAIDGRSRSPRWPSGCTRSCAELDDVVGRSA